MRALVFLLLLCNILFFAYRQGYLGRAENPDAARLTQQVAPERIRVVSQGEAPAKAEEKKAEKPAETAEPPKPAPEKTAAKPADNSACLAWSNLEGDEVEKLSQLLQGKFADFKQQQRPLTSGSGSWWVYIPPLSNKGEADRKVGQLRQLGVKDFFIVQEAGPNRFAISLGVFSSEGGARERLAGLREQGVHSAMVSPRPTKETTYLLEARGPSLREAALQEAVAQSLPELKVKSCR